SPVEPPPVSGVPLGVSVALLPPLDWPPPEPPCCGGGVGSEPQAAMNALIAARPTPPPVSRANWRRLIRPSLRSRTSWSSNAVVRSSTESSPPRVTSIPLRGKVVHHSSPRPALTRLVPTFGSTDGPRVEHVPQPGPQQVEPQDRDHDGEPGEDRRPRRDLDEAPAAAEHRAPGGRRRRRSEAQEGEGCLGQDRDRERDRSAYTQRRRDVRQNVPEVSAQRASPDHPARLAVLVGLGREDRAAHDAREGRHVDDADR